MLYQTRELLDGTEENECFPCPGKSKVIYLQSKAKIIADQTLTIPGSFWHAYGVSSGKLDQGKPPQVFKMVQGLSGTDTVSFESTLRPGEFLRASGGGFSMERRQGIHP